MLIDTSSLVIFRAKASDNTDYCDLDLVKTKPANRRDATSVATTYVKISEIAVHLANHVMRVTLIARTKFNPIPR